jgi:DnaJ-class molecular chaperone
MNPYDVLEIPKDATDKDIKDAYRQLAKTWHPDKNKSPNAEEKFKEINKAYNILIDPKTRQIYDQTGSVDQDGIPSNVDINELFKEMGGFPGFGGGFPFPGGGFPAMFVNGMPMNMGGVGGMRGMNPQEMFMRKQSNIKMVIELGLQDLFNGIKKNLDYQYKDLESGSMHKDSIDLNIHKGTKDGQQILFKNKGHSFKKSRGDLVVLIKEIQHKDFQRINNDLIYNLKITLVQSICGFEFVIKGIDSQKLIIKNYDSIIKPNQKKIILNHGMYILDRKDSRGNLIINFDVEYPDKLNDDTKNKLAEIFDYDNKSKYNQTNSNGYVLCELTDFNDEQTTETEQTEGAERMQCAQQ